MKPLRLFPAVLFLAATASLFAADSPNTLTPAEKAAGWKLLFDGTSTAGWLGLGGKPLPAAGWVVADGALARTKGGGNIITAEAYENFEFAWEWKIAKGGNSGVKYNLVDPKKDVGFEYQLLDDEPSDAEARDGAARPPHSTTCSKLRRQEAQSAGRMERQPHRGRRQQVEHWLNGAKTVEFEIGSEALTTAIAGSKYAKIAKFGEKTKSPILLQDHGDEVAFRSIKLRVLP